METKNSYRDYETPKGSSIFRVVESFLKHQPQEELGVQRLLDDLYKEDFENYNKGLIQQADIQIGDIYHVEIAEDYLVLAFPMISMMVSWEYVYDVLKEKWSQIYAYFVYQEYVKGTPECIELLKEKGLGIKICSFAGIGGYGGPDSCISAILFTPEDIKNDTYLPAMQVSYPGDLDYMGTLGI